MELHAYLPDDSAPAAEYFTEAIKELKKRNLINAEFFELLKKYRENRQEEIIACEEEWSRLHRIPPLKPRPKFIPAAIGAASALAVILGVFGIYYMNRQHFVSLQVVDPHDVPIMGAQLECNTTSLVNTTTDSDGVVQFLNPPKSTICTVIADKYARIEKRGINLSEKEQVTVRLVPLARCRLAGDNGLITQEARDELSSFEWTKTKEQADVYLDITKTETAEPAQTSITITITPLVRQAETWAAQTPISATRTVEGAEINAHKLLRTIAKENILPVLRERLPGYCPTGSDH